LVSGGGFYTILKLVFRTILLLFSLFLFFFQNVAAQTHAFVADVHIGPCNQYFHMFLVFPAKRAVQKPSAVEMQEFIVFFVFSIMEYSVFSSMTMLTFVFLHSLFWLIGFLLFDYCFYPTHKTFSVSSRLMRYGQPFAHTPLVSGSTCSAVSTFSGWFSYHSSTSSSSQTNGSMINLSPAFIMLFTSFVLPICGSDFPSPWEQIFRGGCIIYDNIN